MDSRMPTAARLIDSDEPPALMNGKVIPVIGIRATTTAMLMNAWTHSQAVIPAARRRKWPPAPYSKREPAPLISGSPRTETSRSLLTIGGLPLKACDPGRRSLPSPANYRRPLRRARSARRTIPDAV